MIITKKVLDEARVKDGWGILLNGAKIAVDATIAPGCYIGENVLIKRGAIVGEGVEIGESAIIETYVKIGKCAVIGSGVFVGYNAVIAEGSYIGSGSKILSNSLIESDVTIQENVYIGSRAAIQNHAFIEADAIIERHAIIKKNVHISVISEDYDANYTGEVDGEHLFRLGCEVRPLSWYLSRRKGENEKGYRSGWAYVWEKGGITEDGYRRYLRFFKEEAKKLGIR